MRCTLFRRSVGIARGAVLCTLATAASCAGAAPRGDAPVGRPVRPSPTWPTGAVVSPALLLPEAPASSLVDVLPDGTQRLVVSGMRIAQHPDGSIERGPEVLPGGSVRLLPLPPRLGGGLLVYVVAGASTQVWRASSWLAHLEPVGELFGVVGDMIAGFDRVYARLLGADSGNDLRAFDPEGGQQLPLGPLPPATRLGALAFADPWRALVMSDFRGPLATFDAGNTWQAVPLGGRTVNQLGARDGQLLIETAQGRYVLRATGELAVDDGPEVAPLPGLWGVDPARRAGGAGRATAYGPSSGRSAPAPGAWRSMPSAMAATRVAPSGRPAPSFIQLASGRRPLRAALEDGFPALAADGGPGAIVADGGTLYRVALPSGRIEDVRPHAYSSEFADCHALALGNGFGFLCGEARGPSAVYQFEAPFDLREAARFAEPRVVASSGRGGWVLRGGCARAGAHADAFCFVGVDGSEREVAVGALPGNMRGDLRPVSLGDGRQLLLSPPSPAGPGALVFVQGKSFTTVPLQLGDAAAALIRARLLEGFEEREAESIGGWALLGQELHGVRIALDGRVTLHPTSANVERSVVSGRFALDWGRVGRGAETIDGGASWISLEVPSFDANRPDRDVASCGPVGCIRHSWMRVGWGVAPGAADLVHAAVPPPSKANLTRPRGVSLQCEATGQVAGAATPLTTERSLAPHVESARPSARATSHARAAVTASARVPAASSAVGSASPVGGAAVGSAGAWPWSAFRGISPPALAPGESGLQAGTDPPFSTQARLYAWGNSGREWIRGGHWLGRFEDRFDFHGAHSTASAPSLWTDEGQAADALGISAGQAVSWSALLDPAGDAAVLIAQRGGGRVDLYAAAEGEPPMQWHAAPDTALPVPTSAVRAGATWFLLATTATNNVWSSTIYRVDGGTVRAIVQLPRVPTPLGEMPPRLMRRTDSSAVGIQVLGAPGFGQAVRDWYVLPLDEERHGVADPVRLVGSDLEGKVPPRCTPGRDGWLVNTDLSLAPAIRVVGHDSVSLSGIELRLRVDAGSVCAEAMAARFDGWLPLIPVASRLSHDPEAFPLVATHPDSGRRWMLRCR